MSAVENLLIALAALGAAVTVAALLVLSGWLPRLSGRAVYVIECLLEAGSSRSKLSPRERAEIVGRLWVPW
ncbi:MAG TPA: hypothetical protein VFT91_05500 [Dehalococcoidia bacterium]|nr:hypothetical protein [Dehalococcoidia bacterium]